VPGDIRSKQLTDRGVAGGSGVEAAESRVHAIQARLGVEFPHLAEARLDVSHVAGIG
jgi:hypothetical protein